MPMEMSITLKQIYIKIIYSFIQPMLLSIIHVYFSRWGLSHHTGVISFMKYPGSIPNFVFFIQLVCSTFRALIFGRLEVSCFHCFVVNKLYKASELYMFIYIYVSKYICICKYTYITNEEAHQEMLSSMKK